MNSRIAKKVFLQSFNCRHYRCSTMRRMWRWLFRKYPEVRASFERSARRSLAYRFLIQHAPGALIEFSNPVEVDTLRIGSVEETSCAGISARCGPLLTAWRRLN
jgi:hypothetical protein